MNRNKAIINSILCLLEAHRAISSNPNHNESDLKSLRYLIGQTIRQYDIPAENRHVSVEAKKRWEELTSKCIEDFHYRDLVVCDKLSKPFHYLAYKGASKEGDERELPKGETFHFRDMFHEEHIIPVSLILKELTGMQNPRAESVEQCLNSMHICVLLKEEDRKLPRTQKRTLSFEENVKNVYGASEITLCKPQE